jgi:hypothetical protein
MGYCHYWEIEQEIGQESFSRIVADVQRIVRTLDDMGVRLAGPLGRGLPEMDEAHIAFNGLWDCGHVKNEEIAIPFPTADAAGIGSSINAVVGSYYGMGTLIKHRSCDGNCSYETFQVVRTFQEIRKVQHGRYRDYCKTGFRPYDLAVQCVLLIANTISMIAFRFGRVEATTTGTMPDCCATSNCATRSINTGSTETTV